MFKAMVFGVAVLAVVFSAAPLSAQDTYRLELKYETGTKVTVKSDVMINMDATGGEPGEEPQSVNLKGETHSEFAFEVIEAADGKVTTEKRKYHYAKHTMKSSDGREDESTYPLHGRLVEVAFADGKSSLRALDGDVGEALGGDEVNLAAEADKINAILPHDPVKVGDSWDIDPRTLVSAMLEGDTDNLGEIESISSKATLDKVEDVKGNKCAIIMVDVDCTSKTEIATGTIKLTGFLIFSITDKFPRMLDISKCEFETTVQDPEAEIRHGKGSITSSESYTFGEADLEGGEAPVKPEPIEDDGGDEGDGE